MISRKASTQEEISTFHPSLPRSLRPSIPPSLPTCGGWKSSFKRASTAGVRRRGGEEEEEEDEEGREGATEEEEERVSPCPVIISKNPPSFPPLTKATNGDPPPSLPPSFPPSLPPSSSSSSFHSLKAVSNTCLTAARATGSVLLWRSMTPGWTGGREGGREGGGR